MTDHTNTELQPMTVEAKHYVITKDADGNEIRTEVSEEQVKKDFSDVI